VKLDPAFSSLISEVFERSLNEALNYDPGTKAKLQELDNKSFAIAIENLDLLAYILIQDATLYLRLTPGINQTDFEQSDVSLRGNFADLIALLSQKHSLANSGVEVRGRVGLLESIQNIGKDIEIDWQDALYEKLGPVLSQPLILFIQHGINYTKEVTSNNKNVIAEFLEHEAGLGLHKEELNIFTEQVDALRSQTDRLAARMQRLLTQLDNKL
jgi:ubiquinone biosynthesis protein UbiJ